MASGPAHTGYDEKLAAPGYDTASGRSLDDKKHGSDDGVKVTNLQHSALYDPSKESWATRHGLSWESYKRAPGTTGGQNIEGAGNLDDIERRMRDSPMLQQQMKPRHLQMIAVGGSIGAGLFVSSGGALTRGGPAGLVIAWSIIGVMLINVTQALGEMAILYPLSGGYYALAIRFLDPSWGFAMGWNYLLQWAVVLPLEITIARITVDYWNTGLHPAVWMTIFFIAIILINIFGSLGYAEEEFWSSVLKLTAVVIFILAGIAFNVGGGPAGSNYTSYLGGTYWQSPGAFANGFKGVLSVFVTAAFSFAGTELVGLAASETANPRKTMPAAVKQTFWRVTLVYITSLTIIGLNLPYNHPDLLGGSGSNASPFVIVFNEAGIEGLASFMNVVICISVLSIGLSCVYAGSRTLTALAETGYAPRVFTYVDKSGRPLWSVLAILAFGFIAYVDVAAEGGEVFDWLLALSGLSTLFTWGTICLCHIRFRRAWRVQGHSLEELPFRAIGGVYGSIIGVTLIVLVLIAQFYIAVWPIGGQADTGTAVAEDFFKSYLAVPIVLGFWVGGYLWKKRTPQRAMDIDLDTGRKSWLSVAEMRAYREERSHAPLYIRVYRLLFSN